MKEFMSMVENLTKDEKLQIIALLADFKTDMKSVNGVELVENASGKPAARMRLIGGDTHEWELTDAAHIAVFNEFLKKLELGVTVKFESYAQYGELLETINAMLSKRAQPEDFYENCFNWCCEVSEAVTLIRTAFRYTEADVANFTEDKREELDNVLTVAHDKLKRLDRAMTAKANDIANQAWAELDKT